MKTRTRVVIGIFCFISGAGVMLFDGETLALGILLVAAGIFALQGELAQLGKLLFATATRRANKVAKERRCALCSAPPLYMIHLVPIDSTISSPLAGYELHVCREHHPNHEIAPKSDELHEFIKNLDRNLTYDRVYPDIFHET